LHAACGPADDELLELELLVLEELELLVLEELELLVLEELELLVDEVELLDELVDEVELLDELELLGELELLDEPLLAHCTVTVVVSCGAQVTPGPTEPSPTTSVRTTAPGTVQVKFVLAEVAAEKVPDGAVHE
jgi:hypothetical protein